MFAERLKSAFDDWVELDKRGRLRLNENDVAKQIYDLFGYGALTTEVVDYLNELISSNTEFDDIVRLFERLHQFYENWCEGLYIDKAPGENLPQSKMMQLTSAKIAVGLRQVDIYAGLNVMFLLFDLHRYGQTSQSQTTDERLKFHPCGEPDTDKFEPEKLTKVFDYCKFLGHDSLREIMRGHLDGANLQSILINYSALYADLYRVDLCCSEIEYSAIYGGIENSQVIRSKI